MQAAKMKHIEEENPIDEVYRIRVELLEEFGGIKGYHRHLDEMRPKWEAMGFKYVTPKVPL